MSLNAKVTGNDLIKILTDFKVSLLDLFENKENVLDKLSIDTNGNLLFDNKAITSNGSSIKMLIVDTLPTENISERRTYLIRVSDDPEDGYQEWKYVNGNWEMQGVSKDYSYSKEDIDNITEAINQQILQINEYLEWKEY